MPPLEKNRVDFCRNLTFTETTKNVVFPRFNVCWLSKVALLECVFGSRREFVSKNASFEEDFVSFLLIVSHIFLPPLGGLEGGFIFAFLGARESLFQKTRVFSDYLQTFLAVQKKRYIFTFRGARRVL